MFNDEVDLLELRLRELDPVVDRFLIVESDRSHAGTHKRLWFSENIDRFGPWAHKIRHEVVPVDQFAESRPRREEQQRRGLRRVLEGEVDNESLILFGDVDEIPDPAAIRWLVQHVEKEPVRLRMTHAVFFANWHLSQPWDNSTLAFRPRHFGAPMVRPQLGGPFFHGEWEGYSELQLEDAGVHLQYVGGAELVRSKWSSFTHAEFDNDRFRAGRHLERCMALGVHFTGRHVLRRLGAHELNGQLSRLAADPLNHWLFDFSPSPPQSVAEAYCGYTWLRTRPKFPVAIAAAAGRHPDVLKALRYPLAGMHRTLSWRRNRRTEYDWRRPRRITWS
jgi:beta-1,4-mannosyl-glycoprotein beta-1,4-N-acetylglucosaminyltransferase